MIPQTRTAIVWPSIAITVSRMGPGRFRASSGCSDEISALVALVDETGKRLVDLASGGIHSMPGREGRTFLAQPAKGSS